MRHIVFSVAAFGMALAIAPVSAAEFTVSGPIALPESSSGTGPASVYPIIFNVTGVGTIFNETITLTDLWHDYSDDLDMLLVSPTGANLIFMSDVGGGSELAGVTYTFSDAATSAMADNGYNGSGTYLPSNVGVNDVIPSPAPSGPYGTSFGLFDGLNGDGRWSLYIYDDSARDTGSLGSVTLSINTVTPTVPEPATWAMMIGGLGLTGAAMRRRPTRIARPA